MQNKSVYSENKLILVGVISSAHGIKGDVVIRSFTDEPLNIMNLPLQNNDGEEIKIKLIRVSSKGRLICRILGVEDRNRAEELIGRKLFSLRSLMPAPQEDEFYIEDLKGLPVVNEQLTQIGKISGIFNFGAGDIIEVSFNNKTTELFSFRKEIFPEITEEYVRLVVPINN